MTDFESEKKHAARRAFLRSSATLAAATVATNAWRKSANAQAHEHHTTAHAPAERPSILGEVQRSTSHRKLPNIAGASGPSVVTPNGSTLPLRKVGDAKVGHLIASPVQHEFAPGLNAECWGYNNSTPGPTIEAIQGDVLRIYVTNRLPEPTTVHWHGLILPNGMDGVAGLTQAPIPVGETFVYQFEARYPGTFMYHPHYDEMTQIALGMVGMIVIHPRRAIGARVDRDFAFMLHEWRIEAGARRPDPNEMKDFNVLTFNSKSFPATQPILIGKGERVRMRFGNLGPMDHHPIHLHGLSFRVTGTDGGLIAPSAQIPETTVLVPVVSTRTIEFIAEEPGDWAMHCHMTHHGMTQMGHDLPPMVGANLERTERRLARTMPGYMTMGNRGMGGMAEMDMPVPANSLPMRGGRGPFGAIEMGGMFTLLKVRENPSEEHETTWYQHPEGTLPQQASQSDLVRDGIEI